MKQVEGQISLFDIFESEKEKIHVTNVGIGALFRYLRYGPHTMVPEVAGKCKAYLDSVNGKLPENFIRTYGEPKQWKGLACANCEHGRSRTCRAGGHTCHYEYGILICDAFKQTIDGMVPELPCDTCGYYVQGCCDYPVTPDDYCVLGDKKIPKFSWDADVNEIHYKIIELAEKHKLSVGDKEWSIWSHVPQYGYRMWIDIEGKKGEFTEAFFIDLQEIVEFAKKRKIELSPSMPMFFNDYEPEPMYISSTFMDKERRKRK